MASSTDLKTVFSAARPLIAQWLDVAEQIAALRDVATEKGLDWSQLKALLKAQIQDERDDSGEGKRVKRIVEKAEFASAYAGMLGLANLNENKYSADPETSKYPSRPASSPAAKPEPLPPLTVSSGDNSSSPQAIPGQHIASSPIDAELAKPVDAQVAPGSFSPRETPNFIRALRPHCLQPDCCGGHGPNHCWTCKKAMAESEAA